MNEEMSGLEPDDTAAPADPELAERLIRDEFGDAAPAHRAWFHREDKEHVEAGESAGALVSESAVAAGDDGKIGPEPAAAGPVTAEIPVVASEVAPWDETIVVSAPAIHEAFVEPRRQRPRSRSHRVGMLAGLGVVGVLLAVLVVFAPGGSEPRLPAQSVHDVSPIAASGPRTDAATTPSTAAPTTTSSAPAAPATTQPPHQSETITTFITYTVVPGTAAPAATAAPPATTPTAPPATTTTTSPPTTTTTAPPQHCLLGLCGL